MEAEKLTYNVTVESKDQYMPLYQKAYNSERQAVLKAKQWSKEHPDKQVFVSFYRFRDGQEGFINKDGGATITGKSWTAE